MTSYANDTTASAVILLKEGETNFVYDELKDFFRFEYTLKVRVKILKNDGLDWCNQSVQYYEQSRTSKEEVRSLSGTTYNLENGKIVKTKLSKEYIFDESINDKLKLKKFTLPAAKIGSVIEYKYTISSDFLYELRDFTFQSSAPTVKSIYTIEIPEYFSYNVNMQGYEQLETKRTKENKIYLISYKDKDEYVEKKAARLHGAAEITDAEISGTDIQDKSVKLNYTVNKDMSLSDEYLYINPMAEKLHAENPFKDETRKFPIDFSYLTQHKQIIHINIPEGYVVEELPKSERFQTDNKTLQLDYIIRQVENKITLNLNFQINQLQFLQTEYDMLKDFFSKMASKNSEQIVLKKL